MTRFKTVIALAAIGAMLFAAAGCNVIPWIAQFFARPEKVEPVCTIPPDVKMLVLISDLELSETVDCASIKRDLTDSLNGQLLAHGVVAEVVPYADLLDFIADEPVFHQMSFGQIGRKLDAELVLYVRLQRFKLRETETSLLWRGELEVRAKLVDVNDHTLWPMDRPLGHPLDPVIISRDREDPQTYGVKLTEELGELMADQIVKLFYEHEVPAGTKARQERELEDLDA